MGFKDLLCAPNMEWRNRAPMFYTAARPIFGRFPTPEETALKNAAMAERFKIRNWYVPIPPASRRPDFPRCGRCFAEFFLGNSFSYGAGRKAFMRLRMDMRRCHVVLLPNYMRHVLMFDV